MGDRCWVNARIGGHIASREAFDRLLGQINDDGGEPMHSENMRTEFLSAIDHPTNLEFSFFGVNDGALRCLEDLCSELDLYYQADNGEGEHYTAACKAIVPKNSSCKYAGHRFHYPASEAEPMLSAAAIRRHLDAGTLTEELRRMDIAGGSELPPISAAVEVVAYLRINPKAEAA
ncbi:hypothetical protein [Roseibium sp.]|jgi:hypothetical protein|uniref:hypothetical protein n=1 Tax=Roseibium sp. TaxID=1936156 RepID=UPI003BA9EAA4